MSQEDLIEALIKVYYEEEYWCKNKMSKEEIKKYYELLFKRDRIITYVKDGELIGYAESWRITEEQLKRILEKKGFLGA